MGYTKVETLRQIYPSGTRLKLIHMEDSQSVPDGMTGTVDYVDDAGNVHMKWDNGRTLAIVPSEDSFRKLTAEELAEEQDEEESFEQTM
jgi:hypothetical protein